MTKEEQFAYSAGLLDGEGCFHASRNEHCNTFRYGIVVNMTTDAPLRMLQGFFGGEINPEKRGIFAWTLPRHLLVGFLDAVIPYLMVKRQQAELLRELRMTFQGTGRKRGVAPPPEIVVVRQSLTDKITALKDDLSEKSIPVLSKACGYAYAAGILDGEGSFGIYHASGKRFVAKIQIGMCDPTPVKALLAMFKYAGGFYMLAEKEGKRNDAHYAVFERGAAVEVSKRTKPYRTLKIEQGDLLVTFQNHIDLWAPRRTKDGTFGSHPAHVIAQRYRWYQRCRMLNSESVRAETNPSHGDLRRSDSPNYREPQAVEPAEMPGRYVQ